MSTPERAVFLKQSGERLDKGKKLEGLHHWSPEGVRSVGEKISRVWKLRKALGISGLTVISGAGNIARGDILKEYGVAVKYADTIGRLATFPNTLVIAAKLEELGVGVEVMVPEAMAFTDPNVTPTVYSPETLLKAHQEGKVVLIAGGTGENDVTTDNAVVSYARGHREVYNGDITILKGTNVDGVYDGNPREIANAPRYKVISAHTMLKYYKTKFKVVDKPSLTQLIESGMSMLVYSEGGHDLESVLRHDPTHDNGNSIGTLIVPEPREPEFYN